MSKNVRRRLARGRCLDEGDENATEASLTFEVLVVHLFAGITNAALLDLPQLGLQATRQM